MDFLERERGFMSLGVFPVALPRKEKLNTSSVSATTMIKECISDETPNIPRLEDFQAPNLKGDSANLKYVLDCGENHRSISSQLSLVVLKQWQACRTTRT
jgi:hypothetical protein